MFGINFKPNIFSIDPNPGSTDRLIRQSNYLGKYLFWFFLSLSSNYSQIKLSIDGRNSILDQR